MATTVGDSQYPRPSVGDALGFFIDSYKISLVMGKKKVQKKKDLKQSIDKAREEKTSEKLDDHVAGVVSLTDFSQSMIRRSMGAFLICALLLLIFPYRALTREQAPYDLLMPFYIHKAQKFFGTSSEALPQSDSGRLAQGVPAIMYHGVMHRPDYYNIERGKFEEHLSALYADGWRTVTMDELRQFLQGGISLPEKSFLLTFDDGRKDSYYPVDPLLEKFGYSAVMFTLPQYSIDHEEISPYYLNRGQIVEMMETGRWDIESHSWDAHSYFPTERGGEADGIFFANLLWDEVADRRETPDEFRTRVRGDLVQADESIRGLNGNDISTIAFPFGNYGAAGYNFPEASDIVLSEASQVHDYGITQVRNSIFRGHGLTYNYPDEGSFLLRRVDVNPLWTGRELLQVMGGAQTKELPFSAQMKGFVGWIAGSGVLYHDDSGVVFETIGESDRVQAFLDGGGLWGDFAYSVQLDWIAGERVELVAREGIETGKNPLICVYEEDRMFAVLGDEQIDGSLLLYSQEESYGKRQMEMSVSGDEGFCSFQGIGISFDIPADSQNVLAKRGTAGLRFVGGEDGAARGVVYKVEVTAVEADTFK